MTLYELTGEWQQLLALAEDPDTDPEVLSDTMDALGGEIECKADGYAKVRQELQNQSAALKAEIARLKARADAIDKNIDRLMESLKQAMIATGKTKFRTKLFSFGIQKNPPKVVIDNPDGIPAAFLIPQEPKIDTAKIKESLKVTNGQGWKGIAHLEQTEGLRIR